MQTAHLHRAYWCYENNLGIAKIHYPALGIFAILFENGIPKINVNFLDKKEFSYYWQQYKKLGITLHLGMRVGIDTELVRVRQKDNLVTFPDINLEIKLEENCRYFRPLNGEWTEFQDDVFVEYQPCDSLINVS
ncbi:MULTISPECIES: hypothetical protein [unclassified Tolypothrix]|uniref:hypothetical protein n=1 Tax=unclassified Tolypothrix TaxID=2649714 RepID=UPI000B5FF3C5|nr:MULTISPECIES: hypothetical protein [unclassified Tolypothrix]MBE9081905.1 hypothetical protein [Tolypothrix sp. LEGE 11397]UYD27576.1 hypothetical protein HGR01_05750 [Tolypothrix sp. PCC 7712]UYD36564.1 hypothetical protein HG267_12960 [Tolypothrix sp. PCC 7601]BAY93781.1 hypothetical protein NIES3275_58230 [Microchaete diplosiphon NIES-3275]